MYRDTGAPHSTLEGSKAWIKPFYDLQVILFWKNFLDQNLFFNFATMHQKNKSNCLRFRHLHLLRFSQPPAHRSPDTWTAGSTAARLVCCDPRCSAWFCSASQGTPELWAAGWRRRTWMGQFQRLPLGEGWIVLAPWKNSIMNFLFCLAASKMCDQESSFSPSLFFRILCRLLELDTSVKDRQQWNCMWHYSLRSHTLCPQHPTGDSSSLIFTKPLPLQHFARRLCLKRVVPIHCFFSAHATC